MKYTIVKGVVVYVNGEPYSPEKVKFKSKYSKNFNNYIRNISKAYKILKTKYNQYEYTEDEIDTFQKIEVVSQKMISDDMYRIVFLVEDKLYHIDIDIAKKITYTQYNNEKNLIFFLLQPVKNEEISIHVYRNYTLLMDVETILNDIFENLSVYSYSRLRKTINDVRYGIEFEIDSNSCKRNPFFIKAINYLKIKHNLTLEIDGSVRGFEIKSSNPLTEDEMRKLIEDFEKLRKVFPEYFNKSKRGGLHFHITCLDENLRERAYKISERLIHELANKRIEKGLGDNVEIFEHLFGRQPNSYCKFLSSRSDRYCFINTTSEKTIEVRGGTTHLDCDMMKVFDFVCEFKKCIYSDETPERCAKKLVKHFDKQLVAVS